jgi:hypothetical protein
MPHGWAGGPRCRWSCSAPGDGIPGWGHAAGGLPHGLAGLIWPGGSELCGIRGSQMSASCCVSRLSRWVALYPVAQRVPDRGGQPASCTAYAARRSRCRCTGRQIQAHRGWAQGWSDAGSVSRYEALIITPAAARSASGSGRWCGFPQAVLTQYGEPGPNWQLSWPPPQTGQRLIAPPRDGAPGPDSALVNTPSGRRAARGQPAAAAARAGSVA